MNVVTNTYRFTAAFVIALLFSAIVVPVGMAATSLHCDKQMTNKMFACCTKVDMNSHHEERGDKQNCDQQAFCEYVINNSQADIVAFVQTTKVTIDLEFLPKKLITTQDYRDPSIFYKDESLLSDFSPPIFLLNSTFLN